MNPFEEGMVSSHGFHAVMSREIARRGSRIVSRNQYPFFYNPMWQHLGDRQSDYPVGTHYYTKSVAVCYFWNHFDQVLLRPELLHTFDNEELKIIHSVRQESFLNQNGYPLASDHLPIMFSLNL